MKTRLIGLILGLILGLVFSALTNYHVQAHAADAFDTETYYTGRIISYWTRSNARTLAQTVLGEPYNTLGGWWNDNGYPDPGHPTKGDEGTDCSGLLFKSWALVHQEGILGYRRWYLSDDTHGPYQAFEFYNECSGACRKVCGDPYISCADEGYILEYTDAYVGWDPFREEWHVATYNGEDEDGFDLIIQAGDPWEELHTDYYRESTEFIGIERYNW